MASCCTFEAPFHANVLMSAPELNGRRSCGLYGRLCQMPTECRKDPHLESVNQQKFFPESSHVFNMENRDGRGEFAWLLEICIKKKALAEGKKVHTCILKHEFMLDLFLGNTLINMYTKCGSLQSAVEVFDSMQKRNVFTWTMVITGYIRNRHALVALQLFQQMQREGVNPNRVTFTCAITACAAVSALDFGKQIHNHIIQVGCNTDVFVASALIDMYAKFGNLEEARNLFNQMTMRNVVSWNTMITGYVRHGDSNEACSLFRKLDQEGIKPDKTTFTSILMACKDVSLVKQIHARIMISDCGLDFFLTTSLVDTYIKCGDTKSARVLFDTMPMKDVVSWTSMLGGYAEHADEEAFRLFRQMQQEGIQQNEATYINILSTCLNMQQVKYIHTFIVQAKCSINMFVGTSLVDAYVKYGSVEDARIVFETIGSRDIVLWNTMIAGYAEDGHVEDTFSLLHQMQKEGLNPNKVTFLAVLRICSSVAGLEQGKQIHTSIMEAGCELDVSIGNTLIRMYSKCGSIRDAQYLFDKMVTRDIISWTSMLAGYSQHGDYKEVLKIFLNMQLQGIKPDKITFVCILSAFSQVGLVNEGIHFFVCMICDHASTPADDHYACVVDLLGRVGDIDEGEDLITMAPLGPGTIVRMAFVNACKSHHMQEKQEMQHIIKQPRSSLL